MNYSRLALAAAAAWVVDGLYGFVVYGNLLADEFAQYPGVFRPLEAMNAKMPFLFAGLLLAMFVAAFIYAKGYEGGAGFPKARGSARWSACSWRASRVGNFAVFNIGSRLAASMVIAGPRRVDDCRRRHRAGLPAGAVGGEARGRSMMRRIMTTVSKPKAGLEDTVATSSAICYLDGDRGVLAYCGYDIHDLARHATFEEVCFLLWHRRLPTRAELGDLQSQLVAARAAARAGPPADARAARRQHMDALRTLTSALGHYDRGCRTNSRRRRTTRRRCG